VLALTLPQWSAALRAGAPALGAFSSEACRAWNF
jgi:hypothetical protein